MKFYLQYIFSYINFKPANVHMFNYVVKPISLYLQIALGYFDRNPGGGCNEILVHLSAVGGKGVTKLWYHQVGAYDIKYHKVVVPSR